jgi:hypothetical protein
MARQLKFLVRTLCVVAVAIAPSNANLRLLQDETGQSFDIDREAAAYKPGKVWTPSQILDQANFSKLWGKRYVTVEGWLCYVSTSGHKRYDNLPKLLEDWDVHCALVQDLPPNNKPVDEDYRKTNALTCEITPPARLAGSSELLQIKNDKRSTYRRVQVKGYLRLGTESGHEGAKTYTWQNGTMNSGHWELHPVESVETIDDGPPFKIGPSAVYAQAPASDRYKLTWENWYYNGGARGTNHGSLTGKIDKIKMAGGNSGDVEIRIVCQSGPKKGAKTLLVVPQYYVLAFDELTKSLHFRGGTATTSLNPYQPGMIAKFSGLRSWRLSSSLTEPWPVMQPVEKVE